MKIQMQGVNPETNSGPAKFAKRLADEFSRKGHKVIWDIYEDFDVGLIFISNSFDLRSDRPYVQRLDGIYINEQVNFEGLTHKNGNDHIIRTYNSVDAHIFQSNFTKQLVAKHFRHWLTLEEPHWKVIPNGTVIDTKPKKRLDYLSDYDRVIFSASSWRPNKRPEDNLAVFEHLKEMVDYKVAFVMVGDFNWCGVYSDDEDVYIIRQKIDDDMMKAFFRSSDYFFHMTYLDNCPNSVVEALGHSVPVLCSDSGGTGELVQDPDSGIIAPEKYSLKVHNTYEPPSMEEDYEAIAARVVENMEMAHNFNWTHDLINIENTANRYLAFLEEIHENYRP